MTDKAHLSPKQNRENILNAVVVLATANTTNTRA